jgi:hypothetical protein
MLNPIIYCLQQMHINDKDKHMFSLKGWERNFQTYGSCNQAGEVILIPH